MRTLDEAERRRAVDELGVRGFAVLRDVVDGELLAGLGADLDAEYQRQRASGELFAGGGTFAGHLNCFPGKRSEQAFDQLRAAGVVDIVEQVKPNRLERVRSTMNYNLPGSVAQHYHSDGLYTDEFIICNVAVVDTDIANGAIDLLPGTHHRFYKFWQYAKDRLWRRTTRIPMQRGDVLVRRSTVWHRGMPNQTATPRPMLAITFGEDAAQPNPFDLNDGAPFFFPNWYNTSRLGRLREQTFVKAPLLYSAYRFARSLYGNKGYSSF